MPVILLVEDDAALREGIALALRGRGEIVPCASLAEARASLPRAGLLLLDVRLPDGSGLDFCREVRKSSRAPVIFLTANDTELDEVMGLEAGGDDYITKPFSLAVLRARVDAALRRLGPPDEAYRFGELAFDFRAMRFFRGDAELTLSKTEQRLLRLLVENRGRTLPRALLLDRVWGDAAFVDENALSVAVGRLRAKLGGTQYIRTVYGGGYAWDAK